MDRIALIYPDHKYYLLESSGKLDYVGKPPSSFWNSSIEFFKPYKML